MRIRDLRTFRADGGWRPFSFLRMETDTGLTGWAEFAEASWAPALADVILALGQEIVGEDPRAYARLATRLRALTLFSAGGLSAQAAAALLNACLDLAGKSYGVPVHALFGGPQRRDVDVYWSHCGSFRLRHAELFEKTIGRRRITHLDDLPALGAEAQQRGFRTVKTNPMSFGETGPTLLNPGFVPQGLEPGRALDDATLQGIVAQCRAFRSGLGPQRGLMLDVNFSLPGGALRRLASALEDVKLRWLEADVHSPAELAAVRGSTATPIASLEALHGRRAYLPWFEAGAVDVAVVDVLWNGFPEALQIAGLAETFDVNVAPHNFYGPLADLMSAHFCGAVPNVEIMEIEGDDVPWKDQLLTHPLERDGGRAIIPQRPGWGADVDEAVLARHPWPAA